MLQEVEGAIKALSSPGEDPQSNGRANINRLLLFHRRRVNSLDMSMASQLVNQWGRSSIPCAPKWTSTLAWSATTCPASSFWLHLMGRGGPVT